MKELQEASEALQRRIEFLELEKNNLLEKNDLIPYERCQLLERRARLIATLSAQEKLLRELEAPRRHPLKKLKLLRAFVTGGVCAKILIGLGGLLVQTIRNN